MPLGDIAKATRSQNVGAATDRTAVQLAVAQRLRATAPSEIEQRGFTLLGVSLPQLIHADRFQPELPIDWDEGVTRYSARRCA